MDFFNYTLAQVTGHAQAQATAYRRPVHVFKVLDDQGKHRYFATEVGNKERPPTFVFIDTIQPREGGER
jgi:hypothetical protein